jgi:CBS domain containing-hemolysin-like protein
MEPPSLLADIGKLALVALLVLLNGFFVAAEFALVSVRRTRVEELVRQGNRTAEAVKAAIHDPDRFIAATQLGITIASLGLGWVGEPALAHLIDPIVGLVPERWTGIASHSISAVIAFAAITFMHVVVGELAPKSIALQRPETTALLVARPTLWTEVLFRPAIWALNGAGNLLLRGLGLQEASGHEMVHSVEELKMLIDASAHRGVLEDSERDMLDAIFDFRELLARQVMVPRTELVMLPNDATLRDLLDLMRSQPHAQYPVYQDDADHICGVVYVRDVIPRLAGGELDLPLRKLAREAIFVPEAARMDDILSIFRQRRQHLAIVLDEYGGTAGMITLEDILEEIAGELPDQFEPVEPEILVHPDGSALVSGLALIEDVNEHLSLELSDPNYDTIAGYVMGKLERIPRVGDEVEADHVRFRVEAMDGLRIARLSISK